MKRFVIFLLTLFVFISLPSDTFGAEEFSDEKYDEYLSAYDLSFFEDKLGDDTYSFLEELGLSEFNARDITSLSFNKVLDLLLSVAKKRIKNPLGGINAVLIYVVLSALFQSLKSDKSDMSSLYSTVSALCVSLVLAARISPSVTLGASSVKIASDFVFAFVPVFAAIVAASGGITASFSSNALLLTLAQALSLISSNVFIPVINCFLGIGICSGLRAELNLQRLVYSIKWGLTTAVSFLSGVFVSVLSIKTAVASKADELGLRSIRFMLSSVVPVVGGTLSEGLVSIQSYSSLIKSSVGIVGIVAIALVFIPAIIETALWRFSLSGALIICDVFGDKSVSLVITAFKDTMLLINVVLIVSMLTAVVSFGVLVASGG